MENLSRVKKYENLRKSIELDNTIDSSTHDTSIDKSEAVLKSFDSSVLKKVDVKEEVGFTPRREKCDETEEKQSSSENINDTFTNEYLDDFMKEVREYNIRKGNRESENTEIDILYQLNAVNRAKRSKYIQEIKEEENDEEANRAVLSTKEIALEVQNLLKEEEEPNVEETTMMNRPFNNFQEILSPFGIIEEPAEETIEEMPSTSVEEEPAPVKKIILPSIDDFDEDELEDNSEPAEGTKLHKQLIEETQQLRVQMDEYENELTDISSGVEKTNKILNFVLYFLIVVLLMVIGFVVYTIWKAGGINL